MLRQALEIKSGSKILAIKIGSSRSMFNHGSRQYPLKQIHSKIIITMQLITLILLKMSMNFKLIIIMPRKNWIIIVILTSINQSNQPIITQQIIIIYINQFQLIIRMFLELYLKILISAAYNQNKTYKLYSMSLSILNKVPDMKVQNSMIWDMDKESFFIKMVECMMEIGNLIKWMVMENFTIKVEKSPIKEIGMMINFKDLVKIIFYYRQTI